MTKTHVDQLLEARERAVADRRALAAEIAKPYERGREQLHQRFVELQAAIDAIDRAITDERCIVEKGKPMSLGQRFLGSNHIRLHRPVCRTTCG